MVFWFIDAFDSPVGKKLIGIDTNTRLPFSVVQSSNCKRGEEFGGNGNSMSHPDFSKKSLSDSIIKSNGLNTVKESIECFVVHVTVHRGEFFVCRAAPTDVMSVFRTIRSNLLVSRSQLTARLCLRIHDRRNHFVEKKRSARAIPLWPGRIVTSSVQWWIET